MKLSLLLESLLPSEVPELLYHATYQALIKSIKQNGLNSNIAKKNWEDSKPGLIYLAIDPYVAESYAETNDNVDEHWLDNIVVFKIKTKDLNLSKLKRDTNVQEGDATFEYEGIIPWSLLHKIKL